LSDPRWQNVGMKLRHLLDSWLVRGEVVARFGAAQLVKQPEGRFQLVGGNEAERSEAREWVSLFLHEAILTETREVTGANWRAA